MKLDVQTLDGKKGGSVDLDETIFGIKEVRADILQRMVKYQLAKRRAGTHKTQSRGEVSRSHSKLYKQKGTGQARHGAANAPIFRGGGHAHNRLPRDYSHDLTKKFRDLALRHALSAKANAGAIVVIDALTVKDGKTSALQKSLTNLKLEKVVFIAGEKVDASVTRAARNLAHVDVLPNAGLNVYDILRADTLVLTQDAVKAIHDRYKDYKPSRREREEAGAAKKPSAKKKSAEGAAA